MTAFHLLSVSSFNSSTRKIWGGPIKETLAESLCKGYTFVVERGDP
jgi:hypothetical protein